jgi:hypothetical protein
MCLTGISLRYRHSVPGIAFRPEEVDWSAKHFTSTLDHLPGLPSIHEHFSYVTYPRFGEMGRDMFFSIRTGKAGLGDDLLYVYVATTGAYVFVGTHLKGVHNNPYVHGMDYRDGKLHVTWVYRGFVHYDGWDDPLDTKHKQQAGPNGAENNHDMCYAYSDDMGYTWRNGSGDIIASLREGGSVRPDSEGIVAFKIPKGSSLTNQEAQVVDQDGGVHVLNRDSVDGELLWKHYYKPLNGRQSPGSRNLVQICAETVRRNLDPKSNLQGERSKARPTGRNHIRGPRRRATRSRVM